MKKFLLVLSVTLLSQATVWAYDFRAENDEGVTIYYNRSGTKASVTYRTTDYNTYSGDIIIPEAVTYGVDTYRVTAIDESAFRKCTGLTSVTIPNSITSIGDYAFYNCTGLTGELTISNNITTIGKATFQGCSGLTSVIIPNSITSIEYATFYNCTGLTSVTIPNSVTSIGTSAFYNCSSLPSITIPNSVTSIGSYAFYGCSSLTSVTIPNSVTSIGSNAFEYCSSLTSVTIPVSVTSIGGYAFYGCSSLPSITIPNSVPSIGSYTFYGCSSLTSVTIPNSVTDIGTYAFSGCSGLTTLIFEDGTETLSFALYYFGSTKTTNAFSGCPIETVYLGRKISFDSMYSPFREKTTITSVTIGDGVTSISIYAFYDCPGLTSLTIGENVETIGNSAFYECIGLSEIYSKNPIPPTCNTFYGTDKENCILYVPIGSKEIYSTTACWEEFFNIKETDVFPTGIDEIAVDTDNRVVIGSEAGAIVIKGENVPVSVYDLKGILLYQGIVQQETRIDLPAGKIYIVKAGEQTIKVLVQ